MNVCDKSTDSDTRTPERRTVGASSESASGEGFPQLAQCLAFLVECGVGVDRHGDVDVSVADDVTDEVRWDAEVG